MPVLGIARHASDQGLVALDHRFRERLDHGLDSAVACAWRQTWHRVEVAAKLFEDVARLLRAERTLFGDSQKGVCGSRPVQHAGAEEGPERHAGSAGAEGRPVGGLVQSVGFAFACHAVQDRTSLLTVSLLILDEVGEA